MTLEARPANVPENVPDIGTLIQFSNANDYRSGTVRPIRRMWTGPHSGFRPPLPPPLGQVEEPFRSGAEWGWNAVSDARLFWVLPCRATEAAKLLYR
jgi:hypothetical protein